ncbi:MAG TPA: glutathione S-transferase family protein [Rubrivivax sp.]|nr:glutathione S-transferase family protein [Rubrivivax sp.]
MQLVIGNKNYSSWSMRPWVLMRQLGLPFDEVKLRFDFAPDSAFRRAVAGLSPAGRVPVLVDDDGFAVWDTLAIVETLNERFPDRGIWPAAVKDRARARSLAAEMHAGFGALRSHCPMNIEATLPEVGARLWVEQAALRADVARIETMWAQALAASGGPFLFGAFSAADAFYAPVCMRLRGYALPIVQTTQNYIDSVAATPGVAAWVADALAEQDFLDFEEPYRKGR